MYAYELGIFEEQCRALADAVRARGAILRKLPEHAISVEVRGRSVDFPVASDDRDWLLTTPEEAFYAAMLDADAPAAVLDATPPNAGAPQHRRILALADLLGGRAAFAHVLRAGGLLGQPESRFTR